MKSKNNKLIILDIVDKTIMRNKYVAISKPRTDVVAILKKRGFILKQINYLSSYNTTLLKKIIQYINFIIIICNFYQHFHKIKECYIFIQYPFTAFFSDRIKKYIFNFLHRRKNRIIVLFHDIEGLRYNKPNKFEKFCIENSDVCIFHTKEMEQKIRESGINVKRSVYLEFFDYLNSIEVSSPKKLLNSKIIFAGNLKKASFLTNLENLPLSDYFEFYLYGVGGTSLSKGKHIFYKGVFEPNEINKIEGNWGLVWDGDSTETCSGYFGEYLKINSPFKFSLYIAANKPVIVWKNSAMARYVEKYHLGICVDSLAEIPLVISSLSNEQLNSIIENVSKLSKQVRNGYKLNEAINKSLLL